MSPAGHLASHLPMDMPFCCSTALPRLPSADLGQGQGPLPHFIPVVSSGLREQISQERLMEGGWWLLVVGGWGVAPGGGGMGCRVAEPLHPKCSSPGEATPHPADLLTFWRWQDLLPPN